MLLLWGVVACMSEQEMGEEGFGKLSLFHFDALYGLDAF